LKLIFKQKGQVKPAPNLNLKQKQLFQIYMTIQNNTQKTELKTNKITIGESYKYVSAYAINGIEELQNLLLATQYFNNLTFEQTVCGEVMSWIMWTSHIELILEEIDEKEEEPTVGEAVRSQKTQDEKQLYTLLENLLEAMEEAEIEFILIDRS
jgi:hypothetical protein